MGLLLKSVQYLKKYGIKKTIKHTKDYIEMLWKRNSGDKEILICKDEGPLNVYEYKYYRFLQKRRKQFDISFEKFHVSQIDDLVSIVLPIYNNGDTIEDSIKSVLDQTYEKFELIIIDDGSTDQTPEIVDKWSAIDQRIRVVHQKNSKLPQALNNGFALARGEFLTWTSADNVMHPDFMEKLVGFMRRRPDIAMCYANLRAIDGNGDPITDSTWYSRGEETGNVYLPDATLRLNTYPENTIAAAFMYRKAVPYLLGGYDPQLYTVEDYDYWMRINDFFSVHHTDFEDIIYDYRFHNKSLTSKAKKLKINEMRQKLMLIEDYRQDWLIRPMCWVFKENSHLDQWKDMIETAGHIARPYTEMEKLKLPRLGSGVVQVTVADHADVHPLDKVAGDAIRVLICRNRIAREIVDTFDFVVQIGTDFNNIPEGVFLATDQKTAFDLIQVFCKAKWFSMMLEENRQREEEKLKATIVLCTYKRIDLAKQALEALSRQSISSACYEILVINNDPENREIFDIAQSISSQSGRMINYIDCPYSGLSAARNASLYEAKGDIVLYVDDDGIMEPDCLEHLIKAFEEHQDADVIGGQIILKNPERFSSVLLPGYEFIWSERRVKQRDFFYAEEEKDFPFGCNYAVRKKTLRELGGFRVSYGRVGKDFSGGEETVLAYLVKKAGGKVGFEPKAVVWHDVEPSRYTLDHVRNTMRSSRLNRQLMKMDLYKTHESGFHEEEYILKSAEDRLDALKRKGFNEASLEYMYCLCEIEAAREELGAAKKDYQVIESARESYQLQRNGKKRNA